MAFTEANVKDFLSFLYDVESVLEKQVEKYKILPRHYFLLLYVYRHDGIKLNDMAKNKIYKPLFYRDMDYLNGLKMLTKRKGRKYKRNIYLHLTAYGEVIVEDAIDEIYGFLQTKFPDKRRIKCVSTFLDEYMGGGQYDR
jgi:DNA-binding MarR family transcriptional regulator